MIEQNHECYVSLEVAKLLKEAEFDWECNRFYDCTNSDCIRYEEYHTPTLDVAQRWLREVKGIYIGIVAIENKRAVTNSDGWTFHYEYGKPTFDCDIQNERCETISTLDDSFDIYEEAQEAGIKKVLEIILEKGK
jgi:hypothetical protein